MHNLFSEIWSSLKQNKLRTALTGFAVSWGIFIIVVLLGSGNGLMNALMSNAGDEIRQIMRVYPGSTSKPYKGMKENTRIRFSDRDMSFTEQFSDLIDGVYGTVSFSDTLSLGRETISSYIMGVSPEYIKSSNWVKLIAGRFINKLDMDECRRSIVIDNNAATQLLGDDESYTKIIGRDIIVGLNQFKVVGIYEADEGSWGHDSFAPYSTVRKMRVEGTWMNNIDFKFHGLETKQQNEDFEKAYKRAMSTFHNADPEDTRTTYIWNMYMDNKEMNKAMSIIRTALWILGILTLLSGIVGVSNIMLITVKERTHEFGIRKALGAKPSSILKLIVVESIVITAFFGYLGMIFGMAADKFLDSTIGAHPMDIGVTQLYIFKNIGVGLDVAMEATLLLIVAGTIAGIIPAWKGARVRPIEALREGK
ncbi:MAG: ABC transporter permease [Bacteroidales bacterium]|nr:ABC transporter permease [Bacteroidales bacterium]MBQ5486070.1 ABC transporter permease [Bacteroidales bacterium]MEE3476044.1 ABC transporter permease [Candidatus Cryptobacteroides sp.]